MRYLIVFLFIVSLADAKALDCSNTTTTASQRECLYKNLENVDKELNRVYKLLIKAIKKEDIESKRVIKRLKNAQRAWIKYRDTESALAGYPMIDGSGEGILRVMRLISLTEERVKTLKSYLSDFKDN